MRVLNVMLQMLWVAILLAFATTATSVSVDGALHHACAAGDAEKVQSILKAGSHSMTAIDEDFEASPLFVASFYGRANVIALLASNGVDVRASEHAGITALHLAAREGHLEVVKLLCRTLQVPPDEQSDDGQTPLIAAASNGHIQVVKLLVEEFQADVNSTKLDGVSALLSACYNSHKNTARYLFAMGADVFHKDLLGNDATAAAQQSGDSTMSGFMKRAVQSKLDGLSYTEFAEQLETERHGAELQEFKLRRQLQSNPSDASLLFARGLALAKLRRDGEVLEELSKAVAIEPDAKFAPEARRLMDYIEQRDQESTQELFDFVAANDMGSYPMGDTLSSALRLREEFQAGSKVAAAEAEATLKGLVQHVQQAKGIDLTIRSGWLDDLAFPLGRGSIYGSSKNVDCDCSVKIRPKKECKATVVVETWRFVTHSYGLVGQQMLLGLSNVPGLCVHVVNPPYLERNWRPGALGESQSIVNDLALQQIPLWDGNEGRCPDVLIRSYWPLNVEPAPCAKTKTIVFGATEFKRAPYRWLKKMAWWNETAGITLITPSQWSARGFVNDGVDPDLMRILPHAVDSVDFNPTSAAMEATRIRSKRGWGDDTFVFLHVGSMLDRKGFKELVAAFSKLYEWFQGDSGSEQCIKRRSQDVRCVAKLKLVLKGADRTANSAATIENFERNGLNGTIFRSLFDTGAIEYIGDQLDSKGIAALIKASDTYASSYKAEGFCLPVLEAMAVGVPVIATAQGPTDEFTKPEFAKRIPAKQVELIDPDTHSGFDRAWMLEPSVDSIYETMLETMIDVKWREAAAVSAAKFVHEEKRGYSIEAITKRLLAVMFEKPQAPNPKPPEKQETTKARGEELEL